MRISARRRSRRRSPMRNNCASTRCWSSRIFWQRSRKDGRNSTFGRARKQFTHRAVLLITFFRLADFSRLKMDAIETLIPEDSGYTPALEPIAMVALDAGRMLMEAGASANGVDEIVAKFARGLGADRVDLRIGYASLAITIGIGPNGITRMREVGHLGVNQRLDQELWHLAERVSRRELITEQTRAELTRLATKTPRHSAWVMAVAVGLACAAFGRLLKVDWAGTGPVFLAACIGQFVRRDLLARHVNVL